MDDRVAVIVQARMASTRLPGKVLQNLGPATVLAEVLRRCAAIDGGHVVCCAIPDGADCDPVAEEAERCGAQVFRGTEADVLDRYHRAALACDADIIMRVTSDCPLIDPVVSADLLRRFKDQGVDYACNNMPPSWPHGLDCEVFSAPALARAAAEANAPDAREHVTPWLRTHPDIRRLYVAGPGGAYIAMRWTLDFPEDLAFFRALFDVLPPLPHIAGVEEIVALLRANPEIAALNAMRRQRSA